MLCQEHLFHVVNQMVATMMYSVAVHTVSVLTGEERNCPGLMSVLALGHLSARIQV